MACGTKKTNVWPVGQRRQMKGLWDKEENTNEWPGDREDKCGTKKRRQMNGLWDKEDK